MIHIETGMDLRHTDFVTIFNVSSLNPIQTKPLTDRNGTNPKHM